MLLNYNKSMPIWLIVAIIFLITIILISFVLAFLLIKKYQNKLIARRLHEIEIGINKQALLPLLSSIKRLNTLENFKEYFDLKNKKYQNLKNDRVELTIKYNDCKIAFQNKSLSRQQLKELNNLFSKFQNKIIEINNGINQIFQETDINTKEYKKIIFYLSEANKIYESKSQKYNIQSSVIDSQLSLVKIKNKNLKFALGTNKFLENQKLLNDFAHEILKLYKLINCFVEIEFQLHQIIDKKIKIINDEITKLQVKSPEILEEIKNNFEQIQILKENAEKFYYNAQIDEAKDEIRKIYAQIENIYLLIKKEKTFENFYKLNVKRKDQLNAYIVELYKEVKATLFKYENNFFYQRNIDIKYLSNQIHLTYKTWNEKLIIASRSKSKISYINNLQEALIQIKHFIKLKNELDETINNLNYLKNNQNQIYLNLELLILSIEENIKKYNVILEEDEISSLKKLNDLKKMAVPKNEIIYLEDQIELKKLQEAIIQVLLKIGYKIEIVKIVKIILQEANLQRSTNKELNANLKSLERLTLNGQYIKAIENFNQYSKRRK
ncbi:hypothetical protein NV226_02760 [Mycoplasma iguanae]|uniref:Septation ring formation regulator EzrA n=1 Tax=Mycoplasma iguanae TaxID=292461 RepID=A0ABY5R7Y3_9MOLU|nr:hypothetical protein [Mycoplasma iguanae]UVD81621.1 hypothetical protein NV226_02760 [Mycoplasma iguanae]